ncbi:MULTISPECIES: hypothetical protein [Niastella]|uniref:Lipoprotein n=1 Tax=Niastella soli TaxID=2821487 RepID=A0ABS3Z3M6_9BACT|nr:hypothetical protein [Niastella soli]MBO9204771.1 hypothetical protein [Niastella soli]
MKTKIILLLAVIVIFILPGCVYSLYPLYTNNDLVYDSKLEGVWSEPGSKDVWKFENLFQHELAPYKGKERAEKENFKKQFINKNTYLLTYTENGETKKMQVNMAKLDDNLFLDIFPESLNLKNSFFEDLYVPVHTYAKIKMVGDRFELYFINTELLNKLLEQNTIRIKHESLDYYKIITASTEDLQKFIKKYADREDLFIKPTVFTKSVQ